MPNATAIAAAAAKKAAAAKVAAAKALRQAENEDAAGLFTAGIIGMILLFMIYSWTRYAFKNFESKRGTVTALKGPVAFARKLRSLLIRRVPGFTSAGHAIFFLGWFVICICILCITIDQKVLNNWSKRLGWVAVSNLALVTFLSLKNTPLAYLTGYSYERLNILHQLAGYGFVFWTMIHAIVYVSYWAQDGEIRDMLESANICGIVAGIASLIVLATALFVRGLRYELFYVIHVLFFIVIVVMVGFHRPDLWKKTLIITILIGTMWFVDRVLRFLKISYFSLGNTATITPLAHGGTRIILRKSSSRAVPGSHAFLWIPAIRATETHPFTIVSTSPLEFVVAAYDGFTRDLHNHAVKNPGKSLKASIDGPYGCVPDFTAFDKVLLIAGGSGSSFTFGVAIDLIRKLGSSTNTTIEFVWVVRDQESISWFTKELEELRSSPLVNISIHSTRYTHPLSSDSSSTSSLPQGEKSAIPHVEPMLSLKSAEIDIEKHPSSEPESMEQSTPHSIISGRPEIATIVRSAVDAAERSHRVAVAACGPDSMMQDTRKTVADCIRGDGPSVELFLEQFGW